MDSTVSSSVFGNGSDSVRTNSRAWEEFRKSMRVKNPCFDFARQGNLEALRKQIYNFQNTEEKNEKGYTLLMLAVYNGQESVTRFLISLGADVNATDPGGNSILMGAAFKGHTRIVEILLQSGADRNYKNSKGQTAFQFSKMFGRREVSELLSSQKESSFLRVLSFFKSWILYFTQCMFKGGKL
ncbi:ankyrin repeat domain-containing protein [Leptospira sp. WS92.C1]